MALELTELDQITTKFIFLNKQNEQPYVKFVQLKNTNSPEAGCYIMHVYHTTQL